MTVFIPMSLFLRELILRELFISTLLLRVVIQTSSLWARLFLVPRSFILILRFSPLSFSSLVLLIFTIVFIGGLIVLLVRVTTIVFQEQSIIINPVFIFILWRFFFLLKNACYNWSQEYSTLFEWLVLPKVIIVRVALVILIRGLVTISFIIIEFKGIARSL